jgi:hypothetical protein
VPHRREGGRHRGERRLHRSRELGSEARRLGEAGTEPAVLHADLDRDRPLLGRSELQQLRREQSEAEAERVEQEGSQQQLSGVLADQVLRTADDTSDDQHHQDGGDQRQPIADRPCQFRQELADQRADHHRHQHHRQHVAEQRPAVDVDIGSRERAGEQRSQRHRR